MTSILFYIFMTIFGLIMGSFLTVVISRLPIRQKNFNLSVPRSHCTQCKKTIPFYYNIPLLSYFLLRGRCAFCRSRIALFYPSIELLTATLTLFQSIHFPYFTLLCGSLIFTYLLIIISCIDIRYQLIPDVLTLPALWLGLILNCFYIFTTPQFAIWGAVLGYLLLWGTAKLFLLIRQKEGLGYGDFKLLALVGAWLGFYAALNAIFLAVILGLAISSLLLLLRKINFTDPIPFGPFIALGGWISLMWGPLLMKLFHFYA